MALPLTPYRVVDLTQNVAGPFCTQILADLGADVIKIEPIAGDSTRLWGPPFLADGQTSMFVSFNRNKRSVAFDLKQADSRPILSGLLRSADVFVHSLRPDAAKRLRLDADSVREEHRNLVVAEISAFGHEGPLTNQPGYDPLIQAFSGLISINGHPDAPPARVPTSIIDMGTGMWTALGVIAALLRTGDGEESGAIVQTSLFETALAWIPYQIVGYLCGGELPRQWGSELAVVAPYGAYETADRPIMIAVGSDPLWAQLCEALGAAALARDERFRTNPDRLRNRDQLRDEIERILGTDSAPHWVDRLMTHGVPATVINSIPEALVHPQTTAVEMLSSEGGDTGAVVGIPISLDGRRPEVRIPPARRPGEHTADVLENLLGMSHRDLQLLASRHVIGWVGSDGSEEHRSVGS